MLKDRRRLAALVLAPLAALAACDQAGRIFERARTAPGPAPLEQVALEARALSGSLQPQDQIAALLAPEPVLVAPGQILVGARIDEALPAAAREMGLASTLVRALRADGAEALETLPADVAAQVRARAETAATETARAAARDVLGRLGVSGAVQARQGGLLVVDLATVGASPTFQQLAQQAGDAVAQGASPVAVEWSEADRCPRIVTQGQLEGDLALATRCTLQRLQASRRFAYVEPNYIASAELNLPPREQTRPPQAPPPTTGAVGAPNDPLYALQWNFRPRGAGQGASPGGAGFESYWRVQSAGSRQVRVAVLDTGLDFTHPDMRASPNIGAGVDLVTNVARSNDGDGVDADAQDAGDRCGPAVENSFHGTRVAGIVGAAASNDSVGVTGGAWEVTVTPVRVLGRCGGELADIVSGIRWAAGLASAITSGGEQIANSSPADIINMSLTMQTPCPASMQAAIDAAVARNVIVVAAAGNKANRSSLFAPANCNNVVVVAASDARGELAFYSNFGPEVDVLAPGGDMYADADTDGRPDGVLSPRATQAGCYDPLNQNSTGQCYYAFSQGTSMAAPHVSAALALLAARLNLRGQSLEDALFTRALDPLPPGFSQIECARSRNAAPVDAGGVMCARPSGRGALDLSRAADAP